MDEETNNALEYLKFDGYRVTHLEVISTGIITNKWVIVFDVHAIFNEQDKKYLGINITVRLTDEQNDPPNNQSNTITFTLSGKFTFGDVQLSKEQKRALIQQNATAILFPYVRSAASTIMATCNIPPILLPIINLAQFPIQDIPIPD